VVFGLKNLQRAPGSAGKLAGFTAKINETDTKIYVMPNGSTSYWPGSLILTVSPLFLESSDFELTRYEQYDAHYLICTCICKV
jgi:hypothetical protein